MMPWVIRLRWRFALFTRISSLFVRSACSPAAFCCMNPDSAEVPAIANNGHTILEPPDLLPCAEYVVYTHHTHISRPFGLHQQCRAICIGPGRDYSAGLIVTQRTPQLQLN